jgi:hypothetical protein
MANTLWRTLCGETHPRRALELNAGLVATTVERLGETIALCWQPRQGREAQNPARAVCNGCTGWLGLLVTSMMRPIEAGVSRASRQQRATRRLGIESLSC